MLTALGRRFRSRPKSYWLKSALAILLGMGAGTVAAELDLGLPMRYEVSRLVQWLQPSQQSRSTTVVMIEDDEYWKGSLARRIPIHRDYLAKLVRKVAGCDPSVIALDFNLRAPIVSGDMRDMFGTLRDNAEYTKETAALAEAIKEVAKKTPIVLPVTLNRARLVEASVLDSAVEQAGLVRRGNIDLPYDYRQVPTLEKSSPHDVASFALAAAGVVNPGLLARFPVDDFPYDLSFVKPGDFPKVSYRELPQFPSESECRAMWHRILLVGGGWHSQAYGLGDVIDSRTSTPIGHISALYLHANYVEALLQGRARRLMPTPVAIAIELGAAVWIALTLAGPGRPNRAVNLEGDILANNRGVLPGSRRRLRKYGMALVVAVVLLVATYVSVQNLGLYAEFFFPAVFLFLHAWWDDWRELSADAAALGATEADLARARAELATLRPGDAAAPSNGQS